MTDDEYIRRLQDEAMREHRKRMRRYKAGYLFGELVAALVLLGLIGWITAVIG